MNRRARLGLGVLAIVAVLAALFFLMHPWHPQQNLSMVAAFLPTPTRLAYPEQGMTADVMFASNGLESVVVKRCANPLYIGWLRREQRLLRLLTDSGLPVPRFIHYAESSGEAGVEGWLVTTKL